MKKFALLALIVAVVGTVAAAESFARGGGGGGRGGFGGPGRGGDFRGEGFRGDRGDRGEIRDNAGEGRRIDNNNVQNFRENNVGEANRVAGDRQYHVNHLPAQTSAANRPFTAGWYGNHPNAWQATHPHADAWAAATLFGASRWLGMGGYYGYNEDGDDGSDDTVVNGTLEDNSTADSNTADNDTETEQTQTSDTENNGVEGQVINEATESNPAEATKLAATGNAKPGNDEWLPLGVFTLAPEAQKESTALVQVSVNKDGIIRGSYYDILSSQAHDIQGAVDKTNGRVAWTVTPNSKAVFETALPDLTEPKGTGTMHFEDGESRPYTLAQFKTPSTEKTE